MHTDQKAKLAPVDIAQTGEVPLVQQRQANRPLRNGTQPPECFIGIPIRPQQIRTEIADSLLLTAAREDPKNSELETNRLPAGRFQHRTGFEGRTTPPLTPRINVPKPFHFQMGMDRPPLSFGFPRSYPDQQVLPA